MFGKKKVKEKNLTYAVIGLGRFGQALATELAMKNVDLVVIDRNHDKIKEMRKLTENAFVADGTDKTALRKVGIENCDIVIVCLANQIDASILVTLDLVSMGIHRVIAKAQSIKHGIILEKIGAEVVYPERDMAIRLANRLENSKTLDYIRLSEKVNITKVKVTQKGADKTVLDLKIRQKFGCNIIAIERGNDVYDNIDPNLVLKKNDVIYVTGTNEHLDKLVEHI